MKKLTFLIAIVACLLFNSTHSYGQSGMITTIAGTGVSGFSGDGGLATSARIGMALGIATDAAHNVYLYDYGSTTIRKISPRGIITSIAGNGSAIYSGDGIPATAAGISRSGWKIAMTADHMGNVYFGDSTARLRKIDAAGIIHTIAGNGSLTSSGDGGPATAASFYLSSVAISPTGEIYICDGLSKIRKIDATGIITTIAGSAGSFGFSGDGGPATAAVFNYASGIAFDNTGNLYVADSGNGRIRMINTAGIITTVAGNGAGGSNGDGGLAISASLNGPSSVAFDNAGSMFILENCKVRRVNSHGIITTLAGTGTCSYNGDNQLGSFAEINTHNAASISIADSSVYIADVDNYRIRKVALLPEHYTDSFGVDIFATCGNVQFYITTNFYSPAYNIKTIYGDGTMDSTYMISGGSFGYKFVDHSYSSSGTYNVKHIFRIGTLALDSVAYPYQYRLCNVLPIRYYYNSSGVCGYDSSVDNLNTIPALTEVDSNGVVIDTVSATSGFNYTAYGNTWDVYKFRTLSVPPLMPVLCPSTGFITDTLGVAGTAKTKYFGFVCDHTPSIDLEVNASIPVTGIRDQWGNIYVQNNSCNSVLATVTLHYSPKYIYSRAYPAPSSTSGNSITWSVNLAGMPGVPTSLYYSIYDNPSIGLLTADDTVQSYIEVTPLAGDVNPANNIAIIIDTVKASCDPNEIWVTPQGVIPSDTQLLYTVNFINTGNDTAYNIYVMDTMSDFLDLSTFRIVSASNVMNVTKIYDNINHNILRFDFPNINLLDSTHHNECSGMFSYTINTKNRLTIGSAIFNEVGIYFDNNPVVMTNDVEDIVGSISPTHTLGVVTPVTSNNPPQVSIYPNPTNETLTIKTQQGIYTNYTITNTVGQVLLQNDLTNTRTTVDVKTLASGLYYITLRGSGGTVVQKFVKM